MTLEPKWNERPLDSFLGAKLAVDNYGEGRECLSRGLYTNARRCSMPEKYDMGLAVARRHDGGRVSRGVSWRLLECFAGHTKKP